MTTKPRPIMRAIDVGYGNTKYTTSDGVGSAMKCEMFPSIAPRSSKSGMEGLLGKHKSWTIPVNGASYEVGPDAVLASSSNYGRSMEADFWSKDTYMALVRGALRDMNVETVDTLALGLPVSTFRACASSSNASCTERSDGWPSISA